MTNYLDIKEKCTHNKLHVFPKEYGKLEFQTQLLRKVFPKHGLLSPIEAIGMEKMPSALISYIMLIQFSYNHDENIVTKITIPEQVISSSNLNICYNAIKQLNLESLNTILNKSHTAIGKRYFKERLLNPYRDAVAIIESYTKIQLLISDNKYKRIAASLQEVYDLERLFRKVNLGIVHPSDWIQIIQSLKAVQSIIENEALDDTAFDIVPVMVECLNAFIEFCSNSLNESEIAKYQLDNISSSFFMPGKYSECDVLQDEVDKHTSFFKELADFLNIQMYKVDYNERDGFYLTCTAKRFLESKKLLTNKTFKWGKDDKITVDFNGFESKPVSSTSNILKIYHEKFKNINATIVSLKERLAVCIRGKYDEFVKECQKEFGEIFEPCTRLIAQLDFACTCASNACNNRHVCPHIDRTSMANEKSFIEIKDLRHPIVESIQQCVEFVANDVT